MIILVLSIVVIFYTSFTTNKKLTTKTKIKTTTTIIRETTASTTTTVPIITTTSATSTTIKILQEYNGSILTFKESFPNQFLFLNKKDETWKVYRPEVIKEFYANYSDSIDFIILFSTERLYSDNSMTVIYDVKGIGLEGNIDNFVNTTKRLKSVIAMDMVDYFYMATPERKNTVNNVFLDVIMHEMGHHWCCYINGLGIPLPGHWTNNLDLFNGNPRYVDLMAYYQWILSSSEEICVNGNNNSVKHMFSDLTMYLMGLIPEEKVSSIKVHNFTLRPNDIYYNTWGPNCVESHNFSFTKSVTIQDIQQINGQRIPPYLTSQKNFNVAFIVLVTYNKSIDYDYVNYIQLYKNNLPEAWSNATKNNSKIYFGLSAS